MMKLAIALAAGLAAWQVDDGNGVRDRLDKYLIEYEQQLSTVVAEERLSQRDAPSRQATVTAAPDSKFRTIISEVAFIGLPGKAGWLGFRRVMKVNGKVIKDAGTPLDVLLTDGAADDYDQARLLLNDSASANLGTPRTTNLPNLPLEFLHPRNRHRLHHRVDGVERIRGSDTTRLIFDEHSSPTIIQRPEGGDMPSQVAAWVETSTGRLLRAEVRTRDARMGVLQFANVIWVDFRTDPKLGFLVPYEMKEEFFAGRFREGTGTARYSRYRQFKTSGRIVPQ